MECLGFEPGATGAAKHFDALATKVSDNKISYLQ